MRGKDITRSQFGDQLPKLITYLSSRITVVGECWEFSPRKSDTHYGKATFQYDEFLAHRLIYAIVFGGILGELHVCHRCDNPPCVRPHHLFEGTDADNMRDKTLKGRNVNPTGLHPELARRGEDHRNAKLTESIVREIRRRHAAGDGSYGSLAKEYVVDWSSIRDVVKRKKWKHVV